MEKKILSSIFLIGLKQAQSAMKEYDRSQRDHIVHSVYVFLLGLFLRLKDKDIHNSLEPYDKYPTGLESDSFMFMWTIISTFRDIGYPFESFSKAMASYTEEMIGAGRKVSTYKKPSLQMRYRNLDVLSDKDSSFEILNKLQEKHDRNNKSLDL